MTDKEVGIKEIIKNIKKLIKNRLIKNKLIDSKRKFINKKIE